MDCIFVYLLYLQCVVLRKICKQINTLSILFGSFYCGAPSTLERVKYNLAARLEKMAASLEKKVRKAHMAVCFRKLAPCQSLCPWTDALPCILPLLLKQNKNNQVSSHSRQAALSPGCIFSAFFPGRAQFSLGHSSWRLHIVNDRLRQELPARCSAIPVHGGKAQKGVLLFCHRGKWLRLIDVSCRAQRYVAFTA